jgi:hypothetical protein
LIFFYFKTEAGHLLEIPIFCTQSPTFSYWNLSRWVSPMLEFLWLMDRELRARRPVWRCPFVCHVFCPRKWTFFWRDPATNSWRHLLDGMRKILHSCSRYKKKTYIQTIDIFKIDLITKSVVVLAEVGKLNTLKFYLFVIQQYQGNLILIVCFW